VIASVRGTVRAVRLDAVVIEVGGVGLLVATTPAIAAELRVGSEAELATTLVVREDSLTLFGFADTDERDVFERVQTVAGIGPKLALAMLSVLAPDALRTAVASGDLNMLKKVPGVGLKVAQRILLELTGKLGAPGSVAGSVAGPVANVLGGPAWAGPVQEALVGLGWSQRQAEDAVVAVAGEAKDTTSGLRAALRHLGRP